MSVFKKIAGKGDGDNANQDLQCIIQFLDDSEHMQITFKKDAIGQWLFEQVCMKLNLVEKDYFGLRYHDVEHQRHWLDPLKSIYKQMKGVSSFVLSFRVKFYPDDPLKLHEELTRYFLFLQLRRDLHHGRLLCSAADAHTLAAYIVQSEVGEYDPEDHDEDYVSAFTMLPKQTKEMEKKIAEIHQTLNGQTPSDAETNFLKLASGLNTYGVDPHQVRDTKGTPQYLGITHKGILTFQSNRMTHHFKWFQVRRMIYEGKMFIIQVSISQGDNTTKSNESNSLDRRTFPRAATAPKYHTIGFKCATANACKYLWRSAVEQQFFFTLQVSNDAPKVRSNKNFFIRGSKFRFSGRCLKEVYDAGDKIKREEPKFSRSTSQPSISRNSSKRNTAILNATLPATIISEETGADDSEAPGLRESEPAADVSNPEVVIEPATPDNIDQQELKVASNDVADSGKPVDLNDSSEQSMINAYEPTLTPRKDDTLASTPAVKGDKKDLDAQIMELEQWADEQLKARGNSSAKPQHNNTSSSRTSLGNKSEGNSCLKVTLSLFLATFVMLAIAVLVVWYFKVDHPYVHLVREGVSSSLTSFSHSVRRALQS